MSQSLALEKLFQIWMDGYPDIRPFYKDGIINEKQYNNQPTKLLFICKEPNEANHREQVEKSFMIEWNETTLNYPFAKCLARWSFGILNDFPCYDQTSEDISYLKKIAFMNLKKNHGSGESNALEISQFVKDHKLSLVKEVEIINPSTIILCVGFDESISQELFENINWKPSG